MNHNLFFITGTFDKNMVFLIIMLITGSRNLKYFENLRKISKSLF